MKVEISNLEDSKFGKLSKITIPGSSYSLEIDIIHPCRGEEQAKVQAQIPSIDRRPIAKSTLPEARGWTLSRHQQECFEVTLALQVALPKSLARHYWERGGWYWKDLGNVISSEEG